MRTAVFRRRHRRRRRRRRRRQRLLGDIDDRALEHGGFGFLRQERVVLDGHRRDPTALYPFRRGGRGQRGHHRPFSLQGRPLPQVGAEHHLEVGTQGCEFRTQGGHLIGGLTAHLPGHLTTKVRLHGKLVLAPGSHLPVELQVVDELHIARAGLIELALAAVGDRHESRHHRGPQRQDYRQPQQVNPVGEHQGRTRDDGQYQERRDDQPARSAAAAPTFGAAGRNGHGQTVPRRKCLAGATSWGDSPSIGQRFPTRILAADGVAGRLAAVLQPQRGHDEREGADCRNDHAGSISAGDPQL